MNLDQMVLFEDDDIVVYNKPPGLPVQRQGTGTSLEVLMKEKIETAHFITRIDQVVSGIVLTAKNKTAASHLSHLMKEGKVKKEYTAIVSGKPEPSRQHISMKLSRNNTKAFIDEGGKKSSLTLEVIQELDRYTVLRIWPETGRFHQIRVMLSALGHPIKGDVKYGSKRTNPEPGIYLHSSHLEIIDYPSAGSHLSLKCAFPSAKLWTFVNSL